MQRFLQGGEVVGRQEGTPDNKSILEEIEMQLETERLLLRPFVLEDAEDLFSYLHEPAVNCFMSMKLATLDDAKKGILG